MAVTMTSSVSVKTPISSQPLKDLFKLKSYKVMVDAEFEVVSLEQQEEMTDVQFKKLIELDLDVKFVANVIYWNGLATAECKTCMPHNSYKAKSCIWSIIKVVLLSAIASKLLLVFSDATCVTDAWALLCAHFDKHSTQAHLANVKGLFTKPMSGSGAPAVCKHIAN
ncbi:hypothetical protein AMAG_08480 [Allomyces macrogynus ATCC 38327]|uniref:Uncharacterized protein n=1 Tax=Allomyces macrogynus (strain ATCC 38327) TaxID=578462 RepID=A0A0L0SLA4_ALLM3|nr:hypothetical protein AMAG_08480 [Allomyces macrogynus ATCC 38327]|eukprot:KNE63341.1 hypothetical protein AMAG_08480 [Allomyces macrogynus ATCC 38327]